MPCFSDAQEVYARLGALLGEIVEDERLGPRLQRADTVFQLRLRDPEAQITVKALAAEERELALGETALRPEVVLSMDADVAHALWGGELNPTVALARGDIRTRGPVAKVLKVLPPTLARRLAPSPAG